MQTGLYTLQYLLNLNEKFFLVLFGLELHILVVVVRRNMTLLCEGLKIQRNCGLGFHVVSSSILRFLQLK
jgi:hypothetical protein